MLTQAQLLKSHYYSPVTGLLYRRLPSGKLKLTGTLHHSGYFQTGINKKLYLVHRVAWLYKTGKWPEGEIDHIDGNTLNNKFANLRVGDKSDNAENKKRAPITSSTGLLGVSPNTNGEKFTAQIKVKGQYHYLGSYATPEEAHQAYLDAKRALHAFNTL